MSKIEWCDMTWNPVWGCKNNCPYCYARKIAKRFGTTPEMRNFELTWMEKNYTKRFPAKPKRIFVNSMSDIYFWEHGWVERVFERIVDYPQHVFMFLTKFPESYGIWSQLIFPENCWLGITCTTFERLVEVVLDMNHIARGNTFFISAEPLQNDIGNEIGRVGIRENFDWLIVGAETGNRKGKTIPQREWIEELVDIDIPLFMKDNLRPYWDGKFRQEWPG